MLTILGVIIFAALALVLFFSVVFVGRARAEIESIDESFGGRRPAVHGAPQWNTWLFG